MTNGNDIVEFEEMNHSSLIEEFLRITTIKEQYDEFVQEQYFEYKCENV